MGEKAESHKLTCKNVIQVRNPTWELPISTGTMRQLSYLQTITRNEHIQHKALTYHTVQHISDSKDERENHGKNHENELKCNYSSDCSFM